ncbi:MAG: glycosyltransferase [Candidatus Omnitrophica bacterium]|nr:glycosyltransferase [Candidatus Omnitrophota bacterium]
MKLLLFSPKEICADQTNVKSGPWITSLIKELRNRKDIELHIVFKSNCSSIKKREMGNSFLYLVPNKEYVNKRYPRILKYFKYFFKAGLNKNIIKEYLEIVRVVKPDLIQLFGSEHDHGLILPYVDIPTVIYIQCVFQIYYHKWYLGITREDVRRYSPLKEKIFRRTFNQRHQDEYKRAERERLYYKNCNYFIGKTDWDRRAIEILAPHTRYYHCEDMIRNEFFNHKWRGSPDGKSINLISILDDQIYKGLETIIEAVEILENNSKYKINWYIAGLSDNSRIAKICKKKYKDKFSSNIIFIGKINAVEIAQKMLNTDIYVHPSHIENSCNSICEAMLVGMPIVATATGGTFNLITDKKEGILIQDGDPWSMAGAIKELYVNYGFARKIGINARIRARRRHNPKKIMRELLEIYKDIMINQQ